MSKVREELLQSLMTKIISVMRGIHAGQGFPFGDYLLGAPHVRILFSVSKKQDGTSVKELAEKLQVTSGAVTQFVDALVEKGLVRREEDATDRRILRIKLTELAESKFERFKKDYFISVSRVFDKLNDEEISQLIELLEKINVPAGIKENNR